MQKALQSFAEQSKALAGSWAFYVGLGTFLLYLCGYLSLRFHLTALGVDSELHVLDERYLFAGARFLVHLLSSIPMLLLLLLLACLALLPVLLMYRLLPGAWRWRIETAPRRLLAELGPWLAAPRHLLLVSLILSVLIIQMVQRQCFVLANVLLREHLPGPGWLQALLLAPDATWRNLYFAGLIGAVTISFVLFALALKGEAASALDRALVLVAGLVITVQLLFLPVNHGMLTGYVVARVELIGPTGDPLLEGRRVWAVWEGNEEMTVLTADAGPRLPERRLVTLRREDIARKQVVAFDPILHRMFAREG